MQRIGVILASLLAMACVSARVAENRLSSVPTDARVNLTSVVMEVTGLGRVASTWTEAIQHGFAEEAKKLGIGDGPIAVEVHVTRCDPGDSSLRANVGMGAGTGHLECIVIVTGHGELLVTGKVNGFLVAGSMKSVCEEAGRVAARAIGEARGK